MSTSQEVVVRVAVRAVVAAALAGLLVLMFQGRAWAESAEDLAARLQEVGQPQHSTTERARELMREDRRSRWLKIHDHALQTGVRAWTSGSPRKLLSGVRDMAREIWSLQVRSPAEDRALEWLEADLASSITGVPTTAGGTLYSALRERELEDLLDARLEAARSALDSGQLLRASAELQRAVELDANSEEALSLLDRWAQLGTLGPAPIAAHTNVFGPKVRDGSVRSWDISVAAALLNQDYARAQAQASQSPSGQFTRAVAAYLGGSPELGLDLLSELGERSDTIGELAREWAGREDVNVRAVLDREARDYRIRRVLGLVGGSDLADEEIALSPDLVRALRDSMTPTNVALSVPARLLRGWRPDGEALREAALDYLAQFPSGLRAEEARSWVDSLAGEPQEADSDVAGPSLGFRSDSFSLPRARTSFVRLSPAPLLVTRGVLDSVYVSDAGMLRDTIGDARAVVLEARDAAEFEQDGLDAARSRLFLSEVAFALEQGKLDALESGQMATLEGIRRLERAIRDGAVLTAEPADLERPQILGTVTRAYIDGEYETVGALTLSRGKDDLRASRQVAGATMRCPKGTLCVDRTHAVRSTIFARFDADSRVQLALSGEVGGARMSVSMIGEDGPRASLVLPVGRWLGVGAWLPLAAFVEVSGESIYVGPTFSR